MIKTNIRLINIAGTVLPKINAVFRQAFSDTDNLTPWFRIDDIYKEVNNLVRKNMNSQREEMEKMIKGEGK